jgi:hypothetical protein
LQRHGIGLQQYGMQQPLQGGHVRHGQHLQQYGMQQPLQGGQVRQTHGGGQ